MEQYREQQEQIHPLNFENLPLYGRTLEDYELEEYSIPETIVGSCRDVSLEDGLPRSVQNDLRYLNKDNCGLSLEEYLNWTTDADHRLEQYVWDDEHYVYITDDHSHALTAWAAAYQEGLLDGAVDIVHVDAHKDNEDPAVPMEGVPETVEAADNYVPKDITIKSFIRPALDWGIADDVKYWGVGPGADVAEVYGLEELNCHFQSPETMILDIDLDVFSQPGIGHGRNDIAPDELCETLADGTHNAPVTTIATSPGYINQETAVDHLHNIYTHLDGSR